MTFTIARQLLTYPMPDDRTTTPDPHIAPLAGWSCDDDATGWNALLGTGYEHREIDPSAAPGRLTDAAGLPPAYIGVGQLDIFRDEDIRYALTISNAGVPAELHLHPRVPHEYDAIAPVPKYRAARKSTATASCGACEPPMTATSERTVVDQPG
jgi:acetyl esterase/lipase